MQVADPARRPRTRSRRLLGALVPLGLLAVALVRLSSPVAAAPDPLTCQGYPERRVFLESQSWFRGTGDTTTVRHVHSGTCFPYRQVIDGTVTFDVVSLLHEYPDWMLRFVRVQAASDQGGVQTLRIVDMKDRACASVDCAFVTSITVDVSSLPAGTYEFRIHSEARQNATTSRPWNLGTTGWLACVRSCSGRTPQAVDPWQTEGRGYYKTADDQVRGYVTAKLADDLPWDPATGAFIPRRGTWCPRVEADAGAGDEPVTGHFVTIDPRFHAVPEVRGMVLREGPGELTGEVCIDTTRLADGPHRLFIQSTWNGGAQQLWGAIVIPFVVSNGTAPSTSTTSPTATSAPATTAPPTTAAPTTAAPTTAAPMSVALTAPTGGATWQGTRRFDVSTAGAVSRVVYLVDGVRVAADDTAGNGFSESWDTRTVADGRHTAVARAIDATGRWVDSAPVNFTVDN